jgi:hypothetical protein
MGFYCRDCGKDVDEKQSDQTMIIDEMTTTDKIEYYKKLLELERRTLESVTEQRKKLTYALVMCRRELVDVLDDINKERVPHDGDDFHEALRISKEALAAVEGGSRE